ncbi:thiopeptide-type bacteriocin biosynthesis protein [Rhodocytophaga aerolata]|uniref:Thiopeptide-type bacteriocin biosynthesis protein n=1 Tax=Rhodocytophaga aerolata TaxID=455078 RepID=A0ABT8R3P6_9BACT|nr:thiopeptide-type bacteriocin biosynthesis protein [Rhodocytophaga aerolata]MDO1446722.1 thiopeptide-type bacteriocin biosynthesis protein [Rhodocytophaga aerolata]
MFPQTSWLAAYLCYAEPWETFLCNAVIPFIENMREQHLACQFFFIRYWEKGPHIRLRLKGQATDLETHVKPALVKHFTSYFQTYPSSRPEPAWVSSLPDAQQWWPNNSIQFVTYEPETERYGGEQGLLLAEKQFQASSETVLSMLQARGNWDYSRALGVAIQLHLGFAAATGMDLSEASFFFSSVFENWLPKAYVSYPKPASPQELQTRQTEVLQAFYHTYQRQKPVLLPLFQTTWAALKNREEFEQAWFTKWLQHMQAIDQELRQVQAQGNLRTPPTYPILAQQLFSAAQQQRWAIYDSYVHMTNNRLGILNHDEGFVGYVLSKGVEDIAR